MGFRTIVALNNDLSSAWNYDPELGRKIMTLGASREDRFGEAERVGLSLVECVHADHQTLILAEHYRAKPVAFGHWHHGQTQEQRDLALLKDLADRLGYRIVRKAAK